MRLIQVAKILGISGQELRKELMTVDFGVRPTDREVPQNLAFGIIRFVANRKKIAIDWEAITNMKDDDDTDLAPARLASGAQKAVGDTVSTPTPSEQAKPAAPKSEGLNVLRKLTLEDVSAEAIAKQRQVLAQVQPRLTRKDADDRRKGSARVSQEKRDTVILEQQQIKAKQGTILLPSQISVKEFAEKTGIQVPKVIQALMKNGVLANINQQIDFDTASIIAIELGLDVKKEAESVAVEALVRKDLAALIKDDPAHLLPRAPIVTVMGHVDHGKTSILDAVRSANVVAGESGGITQHIGAYQVVHDGKSITFLDTPGHEAFTAMRARGAQVTDIAILVVSAEEGVKPTTIEAINHAKEAGVPIIVAINKIDRPNADPERVKGELAGYGLQAEGWGGDTPMVPCSAHTKEGIDTLLKTVLLVAEMEELKANPARPAIATIIESHLDRALGPLATVIVNTGTLRVGDIVGCGPATGKVKALIGSHAERLKEVLPSGPAILAGFDEVPQVGDIVQVFSSEKALSAYREAYSLSKQGEQKKGFMDLVSRLTEGKLMQLKIVLKADAQGSLESLQLALSKLTTTKVQPKVIHAAVGDISESDVMMAAAAHGMVLGFHVDTPVAVMKTADREGVAVKLYDIIYKLLDDTELLLQGLIEPTEEEKITGHLEIRGVFLTKKSEQIIGGKVTDGYLKRMPFRLLRAGQVVGTGRIMSLKNIEKDIKEAKEGMECGCRVETTTPIEMGDILEAFTKEFVKAAA